MARYWFVVTALAVQRGTIKVVTTNLLWTSVKLYYILVVCRIAEHREKASLESLRNS